VEVYLEGADGRERELGNFTFFGPRGAADKRVFAFPLETVEHEDSASEVARIRAAMKPFDANSDDVSDVRVELRAWIEMR
jgi:hypothetical protein